MKKVIITGITGQDGSYLAEFMLERGMEVHGIVRRSSTEKKERIEHLKGEKNLFLHYADLTDSLSIVRLVSEIKPDEIYNLAAQSHVAVSFEVPEYTADVTAVGTLRFLEAIRIAGLCEKTKFYQASTSELYGKVVEVPQNENTPFYPYSPYAVAKQYAYNIVRNYREAYGIFAVNGILFNHESERRGETFVTRKISIAAAKAKNGSTEVLRLGNLDALRDWGYAKDYVECMYAMMQYEEPEDFVIATGEQYSVRDFLKLAYEYAGIELEFIGKGIEEKAVDRKTGRLMAEVSEEFFRPTDVVNLLGDPRKAVEKLGFNPRKTPFNELVKKMVENDIDLVKKGYIL